jgi:hypothetical protein
MIGKLKNKNYINQKNCLTLFSSGIKQADGGSKL